MLAGFQNNKIIHNFKYKINSRKWLADIFIDKTCNKAQ